MKNIVVTGAAGFLGGRTAKFLAKYYAENTIIATSRRDFRKQELEQAGCKFMAGDLEDANFCQKLTQNTTMVIHCAALSSPWGSYETFYQSNVVATENLVDAALKNNVPKFILISTPSIYFNYSDRWKVSEAEPLPEKMVNHYAATKLIAEKIVLDLNGKGIASIALRPRAIIGAEDAVIFPRVLEAYKQGKLKIVGNGENIVDLTCVRNVIEAIICCINAPESAYGQAYNITNDDSIKLWSALNLLLTSLNLRPPTQKVPKKLALLAATFSEWKNRTFSPNKEPALTKYGIGILADNFTLDVSKAKQNLNYKPVQSTLEGINEFVEWYKQTH
jgi:2-alkyl-3-oxoalkanoate reductase